MVKKDTAQNNSKTLQLQTFICFAHLHIPRLLVVLKKYLFLAKAVVQWVTPAMPASHMVASPCPGGSISKLAPCLSTCERNWRQSYLGPYETGEKLLAHSLACLSPGHCSYLQWAENGSLTLPFKQKRNTWIKLHLVSEMCPGKPTWLCAAQRRSSCDRSVLPAWVLTRNNHALL